jgi:hypothetical protein
VVNKKNGCLLICTGYNILNQLIVDSISKEDEMKAIRIACIVLLAALLLSMSTACQAAVENTTANKENHPQYSARIQKSMVGGLVVTTPAPAGTPTPTLKPSRRITKAPAKLPGEPPAPSRTLEDTDASVKASEKRVLSGDKFLESLYERPFTSQDMIYQPDLDIKTVDFASDADYFFITIRLHGLNESQGTLTGSYGVEFDRTLTGKGDAIIIVKSPAATWSIKGVQLYIDPNKDVGGPTPLIADAGFKGNGYDKSLPVKGTNIAYARIDPLDKQAVQIAISRSLLIESRFLWSAWADNGLKNVKSFDYNDTMTLGAAGSPIQTDADYPIKALYNLDNTCRLPYGFEQMNASYPGMCITTAIVQDGGDGGDCYCSSLCIAGDSVRCCGQWVCD